MQSTAYFDFRGKFQTLIGRLRTIFEYSGLRGFLQGVVGGCLWFYRVDCRLENAVLQGMGGMSNPPGVLQLRGLTRYRKSTEVSGFAAGFCGVPSWSMVRYLVVRRR